MDELFRLGARLSKEIGCPVRWPAFDHDMFMCNCGIQFPTFAVRAEAWDALREQHQKGD